MHQNSLTLEDLLHRTGEGDHNSFSVLYERTKLHLFGVAMRLLGDRQTAEDVLQEAYVSVWKHSKSYRSVVGERSYSAMSWLIAIVRNKALDVLRVRGRRSSVEVPSSKDENGDELDVEDTGAQSAADLFDRAVNNLKIAECMEKIDSAPRQCISFAYYQGLTHSEIAEQIGAPLGSVKAWIRRGLGRLKSCLKVGEVSP
jgi:RNA polymerase sigma-70 factor (ECF subfamily)